ncbi:MAG TPA: S8 family peptidase [Candidatus Polarisedimenticolaceae bacterium]
MTKTRRIRTLILAVPFLLGSLTAIAAAPRNSKISDDLATALSSGAEQRVIVSYAEGLDAKAVDGLARRASRSHRRLDAGRALAATYAAAEIEALAADPRVVRISPDRTIAGSSDVDPGVESTGAIEAFRVLGLTGKGVTVAVVDSGISLVAGLERSRIVAAIDFTDAGARDADGRGHGTHVASLIASSGRNGSMRGVAPDASLVSLRALDGNGLGFASDVIAAIDWAIENRRRFGIGVINLSLGYPPAESWRTDPVSQAVTRAWKSGLLVVASAGNRGRDGFRTINVPGNNPFALTVGAMNDKDTVVRTDDLLTSYSSRGPSYGDNVLKPDVMAPGNRLLGALAPGCSLAAMFPERVVAPGRIELSGTSQATGVVSGLAALLLERNPALTNDQIKAVLMKTAEPVAGETAFATGSGYVNLAKALSLSQGLTSTRFSTASPVVVRNPEGGFGLASSVVPPRYSTAIFGDGALRALASSSTTVLRDLAHADTAVWTDTVLWDLWAKESTAVWADTALWGDTALWDNTAVWADTVLWDVIGSEQTAVWADTVLWDLKLLAEETALWGDTAVWTDTALWDNTAVWTDTALWDNTAVWTDTALWGDTAVWTDTALWGDTAVWTETALWGDTAVWTDTVLWD